MFGFLNINKPPGITSRDVVNRIQRMIRPVKIGHAGTLDPLATGVLVLCIGPATRLASRVQNLSKTYVGDFQLGVKSDTEDTEGTLTPVPNAPNISEQQLKEVLPEFEGMIQQLPPKYSALKVNGKRAYDLARKGKEFELVPRTIQIFRIKLLSFDFPNFRIQVECGSGTYLRSLGRDIGEKLGSAAVMTALERTSIGEFSLEQACELESLEKANMVERICEPMLGLPGLATVVLSLDDQQQVTYGQLLRFAGLTEDEIAATDQNGRLLCILTRHHEDLFKPAINFLPFWNK